MRLEHLRDIYQHQDIYIVGTGPTSSLFDFSYLKDKVCLSLNDAFKMHSSITPIALMHHEIYAHTGKDLGAPFHPNFKNIKYPIVKGSSKKKQEKVDWDHPQYYYYDWDLNIENIRTLSKNSNYLYYTPEGCSLHAALQIAWIMGAKNVFVIGCDSVTMDGQHYAEYDKNKIRDDNILKNGLKRNYNSYVYGELIVRDFLSFKGIRVFNLSPIVGYHLLEYQNDVIKGSIPLSDVYRRMREECHFSGGV